MLNVHPDPMRHYLLLALLLLPALAAARPNVVVILADDQGWGDICASTATPTSPRRTSTRSPARAPRFDRFFVCPVCAPTRAEFLTGRYHPRTGVRGVTTGEERLNLDEQTIAEVFKAAGYATGAFGKWHNGSQAPYHPNARGFDEFYGFTSGHWGHYFSPELEHNGQIVKGDGYIIDDFTNQAIALHREKQGRAVLLLPPLQHPALADAGARRVLGTLQGQADHATPQGRGATGHGHTPRRTRDGREHRLERRPRAQAPRRPRISPTTPSSSTSPTTAPTDTAGTAA